MKCAYSLDAVDWVELPVGPRFDAMLGVEEQNIDLETDAGVLWLYRLFERDRWDLTFKFTLDQMADFRALHDLVQGQLTPFYLTLDVNADTIEYIYGRKEAGFAPQGSGEAVMPPVFTYRMTIRQEIPTLTSP